MKAIPLGDKIRIVAENESDNAVIKLVTRNHAITMLSNGVQYSDGAPIEELTIGAAQTWDSHLDDPMITPKARRVLRAVSA